MTLQKKMAQGALWSVVEKGGQQFVSFFVFLVIARLVGPEEYGLAMLCFTYLALANLLLTGMADGVVSLQIKDRNRLSSLFWATMAVGVGLSALCFFMAGAMASALSEPKLASLFRWLSLVPLFLAGASVPNMIVLQNMDFKVYAIRALCAATGSGIVGTIMAYYGFGAYAIVAQQIVLYLITNIILWASVEWRPAFVFQKASILESLRPGLNLMGSNIVSFCEEQIPRLFIGHALGAKDVGYYAFAARMRFAIQDILIMPSLLTLYPALSKIKHDDEQQKKLIGQMVFLVGFLIFPGLVLAAFTAPLYVPLFFGEKWVSAVPLLQVFISLGVVSPFVNIARIICRTHNKMAVFLKIQAALVASCLVALYFLSPFGVMKIGWCVFGFTVGGIPVYFFFLRRYVGFDLWAPVRQTAPSLLATLVMAGVGFGFMSSGIVSHAWGNLAATLALSGTVYLIMAVLLQRERIRSVVRFVKETASRKKEAPSAQESGQGPL